MPLYSFKCTSCSSVYDAIKNFSDSDKTDICPFCGAVAKREYSGEPATVLYKGSGYYCTDSKHSCDSCANCKGK